MRTVLECFFVCTTLMFLLTCVIMGKMYHEAEVIMNQDKEKVVFTAHTKENDPRYRWRKDGKDIQGETGSVYAVSASEYSALSEYSCIVEK